MASIREAETRLEYLLRVATEEPGRRPEFYRALLESDVLALVELSHVQGRGTIPAGSHINLVNWLRDDGVYVLPFFSSADRVQEAEPICMGNAVVMTGRELFEATRGQPLHLNPRCQYGREFMPYEVEQLLSAGVIANVTTEVLKSERPIQVKPIDDPPRAMVEALKVLYRRTPDVKTAYAVHASDLDTPETWTLLIAIESSRADELVMRNTAAVVRDTYREAVDLVFICSDDGGLGQHIAEAVRPFYEHRGVP